MKALAPGSVAFIRVTKVLLFVACLAPFLRLVMGAFGWGGVSLGANPVEHILDRCGVWALRLLLLTLAITPMQKVFRAVWLVRYRRMLGLFSFFYLVLHVVTYAWLDRSLDLALVIEDISERPFITIGFAALVLLLPLAVTSTRGWMKRLGKRWKSLHRLVYAAALLGVWHFYWQVKLDTFEPLIYASLLAVLLGYRVHQWRQKKARVRAKASLEQREADQAGSVQSAQ